MDTKKFIFTLSLIVGTMALTLSAVSWFMFENFALIHVLMLMSGTACFVWSISEYSNMFSNEQMQWHWAEINRLRQQMIQDQVADFLERDSRV